jgi:hypothetical protein
VALGRKLEAACTDVRHGLDALVARLDLDIARAFGGASLESVELAALAERMTAWQRDPEGLDVWRGYRAQERRAIEHGLGDIAGLLASGALDPSAASDVLDHLYHDALIRDFRRRLPVLATFDGDIHDARIATFREADLKRIGLAQLETALAHYSDLPREAGGIGALGVVRREIEKKSRHLPIRRLMQEAGAAVRAIKPVFMMSPLSVAQFLPPGALEFDLLVVDEASQVEPVDALGAIARCRRQAGAACCSGTCRAASTTVAARATTGSRRKLSRKPCSHMLARRPTSRLASAPSRSRSGAPSSTSWNCCGARTPTSNPSSRAAGRSRSSSRTWRISRATSAT